MARYSTYSFAYSSLVLSHPSVGQQIITGSGVGSLAVAWANDITAHDTAADGHVMISKIDTSSGTITISVQQTSPANSWLTKWANYVKNSETSEFAETTGYFRAPVMGEEYEFSGVTPQKIPDNAYAQQGAQVSWVLMCAEIIKRS